MKDKRNSVIVLLLLVICFLGGMLFERTLEPSRALAQSSPELPMVWEEVQLPDKAGGALRRARINGGWLVIVTSSKGKGLTFVPDENHEWN